MEKDRVIVEVFNGPTQGRYGVDVRAIHGHSKKQVASAHGRVKGEPGSLLDAATVNQVLRLVLNYLEEREPQLPLS